MKSITTRLNNANPTFNIKAKPGEKFNLIKLVSANDLDFVTSPCLTLTVTNEKDKRISIHSIEGFVKVMKGAVSDGKVAVIEKIYNDFNELNFTITTRTKPDLQWEIDLSYSK
jgi:hypothetical protein